MAHIQVDSRTTYGQLWEGIPESADYMAIIFEEYDGIGAQVFFAKFSYGDFLYAQF